MAGPVYGVLSRCFLGCSESLRRLLRCESLQSVSRGHFERIALLRDRSRSRDGGAMEMADDDEEVTEFQYACLPCKTRAECRQPVSVVDTTGLRRPWLFWTHRRIDDTTYIQ